MVKPHIDTSLIYLEMVQYCKYLMYYLKHISNRLKKFFLIRIPNSFPPHKLDLGSLGRDVKKKKKNLHLRLSGRDPVKCSSLPTQQLSVRAAGLWSASLNWRGHYPIPSLALPPRDFHSRLREVDYCHPRCQIITPYFNLKDKTLPLSPLFLYFGIGLQR